MASTQRVSVQDADAVYRRLRQISDLLERLPPFGEMTAIGGAQDITISAVSSFAQQLQQRGFELGMAIGLLQGNTERTIAEVRATLQGILDTDAEAEAEAKKLSAETEQLGAKPNAARGR